MRRGLVAFGALTLVGLGLTGCGLFRFEQREPWRAQAEQACLAQNEVQVSAYVAFSSKIDGPGSCGIDYPFKVAAFSQGSVGLTSKVTLACPIIPRVDTWLEEVVKPAAHLYYGVPVSDLRAGSYSCRPRNNQRGAKVSEHGYGNALDIMAFVLADGREVRIAEGWRGSPADQNFLREVFVGACRYFTTVLAPGSDAFHYDHIHLDLARHDPRGERRICKPVLKFEPRIPDPRATAQPRRQPQPMPDLPDIEMEQDVGEEYPVSAAPPPQSPPQSPRPPLGAPASNAPPPAPVYAAPSPAPVYAPAPQSAPVYAPPQPLPPVAAAPTPLPRPSVGAPLDLYGGPVYSRPTAQNPNVLNGHGLY